MHASGSTFPHPKKLRWQGRYRLLLLLLAIFGSHCGKQPENSPFAGKVNANEKSSGPAASPNKNALAFDNTVRILGRYAPAADLDKQAVASAPLDAAFAHAQGSLTNRQAVLLAWPGTSAAARFTGGRIGVILKQSKSYSPGDASWQSRYTYTIDGQGPYALDLKSGQSSYTLLDGLSPGEHEVVLTKLTEHVGGIDVFGGFLLEENGQFITPPAERARKILYVGDSVMAGFGLLVNDPQYQERKCSYSPKTEDLTKSYGYLAASALNAEAQFIAVQGRGVVHNYSGSAAETIPQIFERAIPSDAGPWQMDNFTPEVIFINMGANDLKSPDPKAKFAQEDFVSTYTDFVEKLAALFPKAHIILGLGPTLQKDILKKGQAAMQAVLSALPQGLGVSFVELQADTYELGVGCGGHPTAAKHEQISRQLIEAIGLATGWAP